MSLTHTTRRLELATETLSNDLGRLGEAEKMLERAKGDHEQAREHHHNTLEDVHKSMGEFKEAEQEWQNATPL